MFPLSTCNIGYLGLLLISIINCKKYACDFLSGNKNGSIFDDMVYCNIRKEKIWTNKGTNETFRKVIRKRAERLFSVDTEYRFGRCYDRGKYVIRTNKRMYKQGYWRKRFYVTCNYLLSKAKAKKRYRKNLK